ncbi:MAG TPA: hypothetical protein VFH51_13925 [Myxococcota bacterium]|nr:hypothetical protein [Myxococcota bacterium]
MPEPREPPPSDGFLSTNEIVSRVGRRRTGQRALVFALATLATVSGATGWFVVQRLSNPGPNAAHDLSDLNPLDTGSAPTAGPTVKVRVVLRRPGSVFVDGHHVGMQDLVDIELAPGRHVVMARFGSRSLQQVVTVGKASMTLVFDPRRHRVMVKPGLS